MAIHYVMTGSRWYGWFNICDGIMMYSLYINNFVRRKHITCDECKICIDMLMDNGFKVSDDRILSPSKDVYKFLNKEWYIKKITTGNRRKYEQSNQ